MDETPLEVRYGDLRTHERALDFRSAVSEVAAELNVPNGTVRCGPSMPCGSSGDSSNTATAR